MGRIQGAKNIATLNKRLCVETTASASVKLLADIHGGKPIEQFVTTLTNQRNFLKWINSRHADISKLKKENASLKGRPPSSPKDATFAKYRWYSMQLVLLEAINAFEVFYKRSLVALADAIKDYVPSEKIEGSIDGKLLWDSASSASVASMLIEHQLFHDLNNVDKFTGMLIGAKRYNRGSPSASMTSVVKAIQVIFQIRHTLSHNHGLVTASDAMKLKLLGYSAVVGEVVDPTKEGFLTAILKELEDEAKAFTTWLMDSTADYLEKVERSRGIRLVPNVKTALEDNFGTNAKINGLNWS